MTVNSESPDAVPSWDLADRMRKALREAGLESIQMAAYLGVSRTSVSNWINGRVKPSAPTIKLWALRCGVPFEWLLTGSEVRKTVFCAPPDDEVRTPGSCPPLAVAA